MATPWGLRKPDTRPESLLARRATSFDIDWSVSHGHDAYEVRHTINEALVLAHKESRPSVLEITTYRYRGHSVADPDQTYRSKEEIEEYKKTKILSVCSRTSSSRKDTSMRRERLKLTNGPKKKPMHRRTLLKQARFPTPMSLWRTVLGNGQPGGKDFRGDYVFRNPVIVIFTAKRWPP